MSTDRRPWAGSLALALVACGGLQQPVEDTARVEISALVTAPVVAIDPVAPLSSTDLAAALLVPGGGEAPVVHRYRWSRDGAAVAELDDAPIAGAALTAPGERWALEAWAEDAAGEVSASSVDEVVIGDAPPTVGVVLASDSALTGDPLLAVAEASDPDGDLPVLTWAWFRDGVAVAELVGDAVPAGTVARGESWTVEVRATDPQGAEAVAFDQVVIGNTAPALAAAWVDGPVTAVTGALCATDGFADADGDADATRFSWTIDGAIVPEVTGDFLDGVYLTRGDRLVCTATPSDGALDGAPVVADEVEVVNAPPGAPEVWVELPPPQQPTGTMTMRVLVESVDADGDPVTYSTAWFEDGVLYTTGDTCSKGAIQDGEVWHVEVTPNDGFDDGEVGVGEVVYTD